MDSHQPKPQSPRHHHERSHGGEAIFYPGKTGEISPHIDHGEESYRGSGRLSGRRAVVTGGDVGIGRAVALAFAREGADVLITCLPEKTHDAEETVRLVENAGQRAISMVGDIRDEDHCSNVIDQTIKDLGRIDILVNSETYQMSQPGGISEITTDQFRRIYETNVYAMFWLCRSAIPHMRPGSSIINTSSIQALQPSAPLLDYASSKAAIANFTKGLAQELINKEIRVNGVAPGPVLAPLSPSTIGKGKIKDFGERSPLGRPAQPAEIAPSYVFFASQESSHITGEILSVMGGKPLT